MLSILDSRLQNFVGILVRTSSKDDLFNELRYVKVSIKLVLDVPYEHDRYESYNLSFSH